MVFVLLFSAATNVLRPKWIDGTSNTLVADDYYDIPSDSIEMLFLGSSQISYGINTMEVYEKYGIYSYAFSGANNSLLSNYYWFKDAMKKHENIKSVIIDTSILYEPDKDENYRKSIGLMKLSANKLRAIYDYCKYIDTPEKEEQGEFDLFSSYMFEIMKYHSRWNEIEEVDFNYKSDDYKFYLGTKPSSIVWNPDIPYEKYIVDNDTPDDNKKQLNEVQAEYFQKIIDLCKEKNIELVIIKTPKESWTKAGHDYVQSVADKNDVEFFDFTTDKYLKEINFDYYQDLKDCDHTNIRGADKITDYLVEYLIEKDDYTDYRTTDKLDKNMINLYNDDRNDKYLKSSRDISEFITYMHSPRYSIVIQSSGDVSKKWTEEYQESLENLGMKIDISEMTGKNYLAVINSGDVEFEKVSSNPINYKGKFLNGEKIEVKSDITTESDSSNLKIGKKTYKFNKNGLNITVYDNEKGKIVRRATIFDNGDVLELYNK